jgi:hypothetical protein
VVVSDQGLFAFAEMGSDRALRDVDAMMRLAELEMERGDHAAALRLADWVAMTSAGQIANAEKMRAVILRQRKQLAAAAAAEERATDVMNASVTVPAFSLR